MPRKTTAVTKQRLVAQFGGSCQKCGYNRSMRALQFHHTDSSEKSSWGRGRASQLEIIAHPERFTLLCANCHFEEHERLDSLRVVQRICQACGVTFEPHNRNIAGRGKFCSRKCARRHQFPAPSLETLRARVESRIVEQDGCQLWQGPMSNGGAQVNVLTARGQRPVPVSRALYVLEHGVYPDGILRRTCSNVRCVALHHRVLIPPKTRKLMELPEQYR